MTMLVLLLVAAPLLLLGLLACLREPMRVALPVYAALIPFGSAISLGPSRYGSASSVMGLVVAVGLVFGLASGRRGAARIAPSVAVWLFFLGIAVASALWSLNRAETISGLAVLGSLVAVYVLAALSDVDRVVLNRVENGLIAGGVAAFGYGVFQLVVWGGFISDQPGGEITTGGRFGNGMLGPNIESVSLLLPLALVLHRLTTRPAARDRLVAGVLALMLAAAVLMTGSRTGTVGMAVVLLTMIVTGERGTRPALTAALLVGAGTAAAVWLLHPLDVAERTFSSATSSSGRVDIWEVGLQACSQYCGTGSGWGTFPDVYAATQALVPGARVLTGDQGSYQAHNLWLLTLIEVGVVGMLLFTLGLVLALREAWRLPAEWRAPASAAVAALAFALVFLSSMEFKIFWMVLLLVTLYGNVARAEALQDQGDGSPSGSPGDVAAPPGGAATYSGPSHG
jgi:O-antigen ligase